MKQLVWIELIKIYPTGRFRLTNYSIPSAEKGNYLVKMDAMVM
jgi:hypothetical protein